MNYIFNAFIWSLLFFFNTSCKKEIIEISLPSPSIEIISAEEISLAKFEIELNISKGQGQDVKSIEIELEDLTIIGAPLIVEKFDINSVEQNIKKVTVETSRLNHDFLLTAILKTDKYSYTSNSLVIRSTKNNFYFQIYAKNMYSDIEPNVPSQVNIGSEFFIEVDYLNPYNGEVEVQIDGMENKLPHELDLLNGVSIDGMMHTNSAVLLSNDILPGVYEVTANIEGFQFKVENKFRVLEGYWNKVNENFPGDRRGEQAFFILDNMLYFIGGHTYSSSSNDTPVWALDLESMDWQEKKYFPWPSGYNYKCQILPAEINYNGFGYIVIHTQNSEIELWRYNHINDEWSFVTSYPGKGLFDLNCFEISGKLYIGGGYIRDGKDSDDFWSYNIDKNEWIQLNNLPFSFYHYFPNKSCVNNEIGYIFEFPGTLWKYSPSTDEWTELQSLPGKLRYGSAMAVYNGNIFIIGGSYSDYGTYALKDCWEYLIEKNNWKLMAFLPDHSSYATAIEYNGKLLCGLGYSIHGSIFNDNPVIYELTLTH